VVPLLLLLFLFCASTFYGLDFGVHLGAIYVLLSSLSIVWVYCICLLLDRSRREAFFASATLAMCWEVQYHSRLSASDAVLMQFTLLSFLCMIAAMKRRSPGWLYVAAIAAGVSAEMRTAGMLILPFLLLAAVRMLWYERPSVRYVARHALLLAGTTAILFLLKHNYAAGLKGYPVKPGFAYIAEALRYLLLQGFSHYRWISIFLSLICLVGLFVLARERRPIVILAAGFCIAHVAVFSLQSTFQVRDLLVIVPFLCVAAARGIAFMSQRLNRLGGRVIQAAIAIVLVVNFGWELYAAQQTGHRADFPYLLREFEDYAASSPKETFFLSAKLMASLNRLPDPTPGNITENPGSAFTKVALLQSEAVAAQAVGWPASFWGRYDKVFGGHEVNLEAYPDFGGNERILVVSTENLERFALNPESLAAPTFAVSKTEVVAGSDFYVVKVRSMASATIVVRYSLNGGAPLETAVPLDSKGEKRIDVGSTVGKGSYRFLGYRKDLEKVWHHADVTVVVR
jgi:hypothetical protein